jgi:hypothetical protein
MAALDAPDSALSTWRRVADTWCAAWFASPPVPPGTFRALADAILTGCSSLPGATVAELSRRSTEAAQARRLFHWELEFPEAFFDRDGTRLPHAGFDAIVGNPPWDMVRADTGADRARARADATALVRFSRDSGVYDTRSDGHVNRYQLFVERAVALTRPGGRLGLVLPSGILSDSGSAALRRLILSRCDVERLVGFDNRTGTFPIHRSVRFVLLSATAGTATREIACRFGETDVTALDRAVDAADASDPHWFATRVTTGLLARISGDDLSIPDVRSPIDVAIVDRAAALFPPLSSPGGWHARFSRELNASDDRSAFRTDGVGLPVLEGKSIQPFRTDTGHTRFHIPPADADRLLGPRYRRTRLAYRDVASATNRVTLIAALLPPHSVSVHTLFCLRTTLPPRSQRLLCALFNSLVVNFLVRLRVTTHVTTAIVERLPVPPEDRCGPDAAVLTACAEVLASGHEVDRWVQLNAVVARLYRLTEQEFAHVLSTFPLIDRGERDAMLRAFRIGT